MEKTKDKKLNNTNSKWWTRLIEPTILVVIVACTIGITWGLPQLFSVSNFHYPSLPLDDKIPIVSQFVWFYYLTFPLAIASVYIMYFKDRKNLYNVLITVEIAFLLSGIIYFVYQTEFIKPYLEPNTLSDKMLLATWDACNPTCCFPSQHVYMAMACIFAMIFSKKINVYYRIFEIFSAVMIVLSTLFCRQHYILDVVASVIIMSLIYLIVRMLALGEKMDKKLHTKKEKHIE